MSTQEDLRIGQSTSTKVGSFADYCAAHPDEGMEDYFRVVSDLRMATAAEIGVTPVALHDMGPERAAQALQQTRLTVVA